MASPGNRIRELRVAAGLHAHELADRIGTTQSTISRLEAGTRGLTIDWLYRIALGLGVRAADLLDNEAGLAFATVRGRLAFTEAMELKGGMMMEPQEHYLVAIPKPLSKGPIDAFETEQGLVYCDETPPTAWNLEQTFVIYYNTISGAKLLSTRQLEADGTRHVFYSREAAPSERTIPVGDRRIMQVWRVLAEYRKLRGRHPLTI